MIDINSVKNVRSISDELITKYSNVETPIFVMACVDACIGVLRAHRGGSVVDALEKLMSVLQNVKSTEEERIRVKGYE